MVDEGVPSYWISQRNSHKILLGTWFLIGFIIGSAYKGSLFGSLVKIRYEKPINTLQVEGTWWEF